MKIHPFLIWYSIYWIISTILIYVIYDKRHVIYNLFTKQMKVVATNKMPQQ